MLLESFEITGMRSQAVCQIRAFTLTPKSLQLYEIKLVMKEREEPINLDESADVLKLYRSEFAVSARYNIRDFKRESCR